MDLVSLKELSLPVAIVLAAEFHRWSLKRKRRLHARSSTKWAPEVRALLSELGVFELLGTRNVAPDEVTEDDLILTSIKSGERHDGGKIDELQSEFTRSLEGFTRRPQLYEGLSEAVENAISHAYPADYEPKHPFAGHRWWGASSLNLSEQRLRFFIFDQGAGIPFTLPKGALWEQLVPLLATLTGGLVSEDAPMLKAAFEVGRTRTGMSHRGLGLQKMADVVIGRPGGYLRIISGKAEIRIEHDGRIASSGLPEHIGGTLIEWSLPADAFTREVVK